MLRLPTIIVVAAAAIALAGCRAAPIYNATDIVYPSPAERALTLDDYRGAIIRAGAKRGWTFNEEAPGHLVGTVSVRAKHFATVDVFFDTEKFSIAYKSSQNLNHDPSRGEIHPNYNAWVRNLQTDIETEIALLRAGA